jgi:hypothetical protein
MIKSLKMLMSFLVEFEDGLKKVVFLDLDLGEVYWINSSFNLEKVEDNIRQFVLDNVLKKQKELNPEIPEEELQDAMNAEKDLSHENAKHIFRRNNA